ncbi:hypothetical protein W97_03460 [Coniosporium apollinis CBS 100218]|uniref:Rhamnogalacturonase A/B/Epimerase-like pectate lyase domain-containing protein n=1 Tax=Coniosporium apollinis (strain CBS 100218) TaxID=1168221 RepID=R7YQN2_CONA1|nr:uncharacterized protein W97_03460 [Coniosporium apollinis CBS 100218]EON64230.1 hypothetical protein W97_03460 [Coniosporium apollinis CBS 100218]
MPSLVQTDKLIPRQVAAFSPAENASMAMVELEDRQSTWSSRWWFGNIRRQGKVAYNTNPDYQLFRNVRDFGAMGDGITDDTDALNLAVLYGNRCGNTCESSTVQPGLIYFPPGTYRVREPIIMYYNTHVVGDAVDLPVVKALPNFYGIGVFDSDPYYPNIEPGKNWWQNQNNFFRQLRNFVIDITEVPPGRGACVHWQVAQATSLQNIRCEMVQGGGSNNKQYGIFMDNGSGGWMSDMTFNGGNYGALFGNQQFTVRNFTFNNCQTGIFMNWGWTWSMIGFTFNNVGVGIEVTNLGDMGSLLVQDATFNNVPTGVLTSFDAKSSPHSGGTVVLDNADCRGCQVAVSGPEPDFNVIYPGGTIIQSWIQGRVYHGYEASESINNMTCYEPATQAARIQQAVNPPPKPSVLLDNSGKIFTRKKPQYEDVPLSQFISMKDRGAKGDGVTDDSDIIQSVINTAREDQIIYFDHGAYVVTKQIFIPPNRKFVGECFALIMIKGNPNFMDMANPKPVFIVGRPGDVGTLEMSDIMFETMGPSPGAILMEWNLEASAQGTAGLWDTHWRIGGTAGTQFQEDRCLKTPSVKTSVNPECICAFMILHVTASASMYMENIWGWVSDHELDMGLRQQINIYNGRGVLVETTKGIWLLGTSFEHSVLYNYQVANAQNVYMSLIQSETAYMQANPNSLTPFPADPRYDDPTFSNCFLATCPKTIALRIVNSQYILIYGAGLYSFFENYKSDCLQMRDCQEHILAIDNSQSVYIYTLATVGTTNMVTVDGVGVVNEQPNKAGFPQAIAIFEYQ